MKAGRVVRIRLSPLDCLSCVDVIDLLEINVKHMSFDQVVRIALSSLIASARASGVIKTPDGFAFLNTMDRFQARNRVDKANKMGFTKLIEGLGESYSLPSLVPVSHNITVKLHRCNELAFIRDQDLMNFTQAQGEEYIAIAKELDTLNIQHD